MPIVVDTTGNPGTALTLTRLWLNSVAEPADMMSFSIASFAAGRVIEGEVRANANGRLRLIRRATVSRSREAVIRLPTVEQLRWLDDHAGTLLIVRDPEGGKFAATYLDLSFVRLGVGKSDMTLSLSEVTHSEAV